MNALNQIAYIRPPDEFAASFIEKLEVEGFLAAIFSTDDEYLASLEIKPPSAILLDPAFELQSISQIAGNLKDQFPYIPVIPVMRDRSGIPGNISSMVGVDGICLVNTPSSLLAVALRGIIRSSFMIRELIQSNRELSERSITDSLTGLYNRGYMMERLNTEWKRAQRSRETLSCIMIDIDHFKSINDRYGHKFGDIILKAVSSRTKSLIRDIDIFGRYGGEEFVLILPNTNLEGAGYLAEKLRAGLEAEKFQHDCFSLTVTASYGVASTENPEVVTADHLLQFSDRALYQAKETGRNRVCITGKMDDYVAPAARPVGVVAETTGPRLSILSRHPQKNPYVRRIMECGVFDPVVYQTEEDLLDAFQQEIPHMLLVAQDGRPDSEPIDFCGRLKHQIQDLFVPLVLLADSGDEETREAALRAGVDDFITPDISVGSFLAHVRLMIRFKSLHDQLRNTGKNLSMARDRLVKAERLNALGEMATGIAHDFNNILSAILGRTQLLRQRVTDASVVRSLEVIEKAANDGAATIRRIQEFSRSTMSSTSTSQVVDMAEIVRDSIQLTRTKWKDQAEMKGVQYAFKTDFNGKLTVEGNPSDLREVMINLIMNAVDAMPNGGLMRFEGSVIEDHVNLTLTDTGSGMNEEVLKRIFDPFFSTKEGEGTGLGLSVAYGIIMRHGGRIECFSEEGRGTTFRIQIPFHSSNHLAVPGSIEEQLEPAPPPKTLEILVVDDEQAVREVFKDIFMQEGHIVHTAISGKDALVILEKHAIDLLFTDLSMPEMSGWELASTVRQTHPDTRIVLTSGWGKDFNQEQVARHGIDLVLPKPVPFDTLQRLANQVAEGRPLSLTE